MANKNQSPCATCTRVKDPSDCENKNCKVWKEWFLRRWKEIHGYSSRYSCSAKMDGGNEE